MCRESKHVPITQEAVVLGSHRKKIIMRGLKKKKKVVFHQTPGLLRMKWKA